MMERFQPIFISGIAYELGSIRPVESLNKVGVSFEEIQDLLSKGVNSYSCFTDGMTQKIISSVNRTLDAVNRKARDIQAVILVSESQEQLLLKADKETMSSRALRNQFIDLIASCGIKSASFHFVSFGGCVNLINSIFMAQSILARTQVNNILVVALDAHQDDSSRLMQEAVTVSGDAIASWIISRSETEGDSASYAVDYVSLAAYEGVTPNGEIATNLLQLFKAVKAEAANCYDTCNLQPRDYAQLILGNYNKPSSLTYSKLLGFDSNRLYLDSVGKIGHISFDSMINLYEYDKSHYLPHDQFLLMFLCGPHSCGAISLRKTGAIKRPLCVE